MKKSDLIERLIEKCPHIAANHVERAVKEILEIMASTLQKGHRIEVRGFGSFSLRYRAPRVGRNPKTGQQVDLAAKCVPHFKPGKELRERVNQSCCRSKFCLLSCWLSGKGELILPEMMFRRFCSSCIA